jgi:SHS2 domain-containing protein
MSFRFIEHTADIAVEVEGNTIEEVFISACQAWRESVVDLISLQKETSKKIILCGSSFDLLLMELLSEINFQLYTKKWLFVNIHKLLITETDSGYQLDVEMFGQKFNELNHRLKEEIKAVTFHQMKIQKYDSFFKTRIIFDI